MARPAREIVWTLQARTMLDEAVYYIAQHSPAAAQRLLIDALEAAASLARLSERGRRLPELEDSDVRELFVQPYRLIYEVHRTEVHILAFLHGARDFGKWRRETRSEPGAAPEGSSR